MSRSEYDANNNLDPVTVISDNSVRIRHLSPEELDELAYTTDPIVTMLGMVILYFLGIVFFALIMLL